MKGGACGFLGSLEACERHIHEKHRGTYSWIDEMVRDRLVDRDSSTDQSMEDRDEEDRPPPCGDSSSEDSS